MDMQPVALPQIPETLLKLGPVGGLAWPDSLSMNRLSRGTPSSCRSGFWSMALTRMYPMFCPLSTLFPASQGV